MHYTKGGHEYNSNTLALGLYLPKKDQVLFWCPEYMHVIWHIPSVLRTLFECEINVLFVCFVRLDHDSLHTLCRFLDLMVCQHYVYVICVAVVFAKWLMVLMLSVEWGWGQAAGDGKRAGESDGGLYHLWCTAGCWRSPPAAWWARQWQTTQGLCSNTIVFRPAATHRGWTVHPGRAHWFVVSHW